MNFEKLELIQLSIVTVLISWAKCYIIAILNQVVRFYRRGLVSKSYLKLGFRDQTPTLFFSQII